jgi:uncharacterized protein YjcR
MSDDRSKRDERDRARVSGSEGYEVRYFAEKHGISPDEARKLIDKHGNDRKTLDAEAEKLKMQ